LGVFDTTIHGCQELEPKDCFERFLVGGRSRHADKSLGEVVKPLKWRRFFIFISITIITSGQGKIRPGLSGVAEKPF
jgi:hypothetical protein